jgi:cell division protease FtsH
MTLGGRVAEQIFFGKISTGAQNDLERITKLAYSMITIYGMSTKVGNVSFNDPTGEYGYQRPYSEQTAQIIDQEVRELIDSAYKRTIELLMEKKSEVEAVALELLDKEIIFKSDLDRIIGKRPFEEDEDITATIAAANLTDNEKNEPILPKVEPTVSETPVAIEPAKETEQTEKSDIISEENTSTSDDSDKAE